MLKQIIDRHCEIIVEIYHDCEEFLRPFLTQPINMRYSVAPFGDVLRDQRVMMEIFVHDTKHSLSNVPTIAINNSGSL